MNRGTATGNAVTTYLEQEIRNDSPVGLIVRVYEIAIVDLGRARAALTAGNWAVKGRSISRVSRAISLLQCSLKMEEGGEIAKNLDRLYGYLLRRLSDGHINNDDAILEEVGQHLSDLAGAWREAQAPGGEAAPAKAAEGALAAIGGAP